MWVQEHVSGICDCVAWEITFQALCFSPHKTASTTSGFPDTSCSVEGEETHTLSFTHTHTHKEQIFDYASTHILHFSHQIKIFCTHVLVHIHVHTHFWQRWPKCEMSCKGWGGCTEVPWPHDASALSPNLSVLCGTSDRNSKRDVCFGARNPSPLSLGV